MRLISFIAVILAVALLFAFVACNGDEGEEVTGGETPTPEALPTPTPRPEPIIVYLSVRDFAFSPSTLEFVAGVPTSLRFTNEGMFPHTMTAYWDDAFTVEVFGADTGTVQGGETKNIYIYIEDPETIYFRCELHPEMQGIIEVRERDGAADSSY
jgi:plastocyanin